MPDETFVYTQRSFDYDRLIRREDYLKNLDGLLKTLIPDDPFDLVDSGTGSARVAKILLPYARKVYCFDSSAHMLEKAKLNLLETSFKNWETHLGDHRAISMPNGSADVVTSGWSVCYLVEKSDPENIDSLESALEEFHRILRRRGTLIIIETMGTGVENPEPPLHLLPYYNWLGNKGFSKRSIRTDYRFESMEEATELSTFFFGEGMVEKIKHERSPILPECTGVWWKRID